MDFYGNVYILGTRVTHMHKFYLLSCSRGQGLGFGFNPSEISLFLPQVSTLPLSPKNLLNKAEINGVCKRAAYYLYVVGSNLGEELSGKT